MTRPAGAIRVGIYAGMPGGAMGWDGQEHRCSDAEARHSLRACASSISPIALQAGE